MTDVLLYIHIIAGAVGITNFWLPVVTPKGGPLHRVAGWAFIVGMMTTALSAAGLAVVLAVEHGEVVHATLLGGLLLLCLGAAFSGIQALRPPRRLRVASRLVQITTGLGAVGTAAVAVAQHSVVLGGAALVLLVQAGATVRQPDVDRVGSHAGGMIAAGVVLHTTFAWFGLRRWLDVFADNTVVWLVWVGPAVIGFALGTWLLRRYRRGLPPKPR